MSNLEKVVQQLRMERNQAQKRVEQLDEALEALAGFGRGGTEIHHVRASGKRRTMSANGPKTNSSSSTCSLGEMEGCQESVRHFIRGGIPARVRAGSLDRQRRTAL